MKSMYTGNITFWRKRNGIVENRDEERKEEEEAMKEEQEESMEKVY